MATQLKLQTLTPATDRKLLNTEWVELANEGETAFNTEGCSITIGRAGGGKARPRTVTTLKAGLILKAGERVRLVTGSPGKGSQGEPPAEEEGVRNYHLFLKAPYLERSGLVVRLVNRQLVEICRATLEQAEAEPA